MTDPEPRGMTGHVPVWTAFDELVPIGKLRPNPRNPNLHSDDQIRRLAKIIAGQGWRAVVQVSTRSGQIVRGHGRLAAARLLKLPTVPVEFQHYADDESEMADLLADNRIAELAEWDMPVLKDILQDLDTGALDLEFTGWTDEEIEDMMTEFHVDDGEPADGDDEEPPTFQVFTAEAIVESAFQHFRAAGFPYRNVALHVAMQEINKLANAPDDSLIRTLLGYHVADTYHPHRFHARADNMKTPVEAFQNDKLFRRALALQLKHGPVGTTYPAKLSIVSGTQACANFRPGFALSYYRRYAKRGATVLDASTGYGGRLVGFMASGLGRYVGIDPNKQTHDANLRMARELGFADAVELYNVPAEDMNADLIRGRCDFSFTSPPYFAKEQYANDDSQSWVRYKTGDAWTDGFLVPMMRLQFDALKRGCHAVVNIADVKLRGKVYPLTEWIVAAGKQAGFELVGRDDYPLISTGSMVRTDDNEPEMAVEPVFIFRKP